MSVGQQPFDRPLHARAAFPQSGRISVGEKSSAAYTGRLALDLHESQYHRKLRDIAIADGVTARG